MTNLDSVQKQRHHSANKGSYTQGYGLPTDYVQFWELDCKEGWASENWCLWTVVLEKTPESPLGSKEITLDESERGECKSWLKAQHSEN